MKNKLCVLVEKIYTGFSANLEKFQADTAGNTLDEIRLNIIESMNLYLHDMEKP